MISKIVG